MCTVMVCLSSCGVIGYKGASQAPICGTAPSSFLFLIPDSVIGAPFSGVCLIILGL